jgi:PIN domain nuclease of toxin-antitoxin system
LLDTHALLWWVFADSRLPRRVRLAIGDDIDNQVFVSAASAWEITTKHRIGKLPDARIIAEDVAGALAAEGFSELAVSVRHAQRAGSLAGLHQDPFDRMLIAQSMLDGLTLVSNERVFDLYGVSRLW